MPLGKITKIYGTLCNPSKIKLILCIIGATYSVVSTINSDVNLQSTIVDIVPLLLNCLFWVWLLNIICKGGADWVAWVIVLLPLLEMVVIKGVLSERFGGSGMIKRNMAMARMFQMKNLPSF